MAAVLSFHAFLRHLGDRVLLAILQNLEQVIFQLRFSQGYLYLDRCGKILNEIGKDYPDWVVSNNVSPQGAALISNSNGCILNFSSAAIGFLHSDAIQRKRSF